MFRNFMRVALRNLWKHRGFAVINIFGLAVGLASSIFILLYVVNELTYDRFHEKADRTYRIWISGSMPATEMRHAVSSAPMARALLDDYPEVEQVVRLRQSGGWLVRTGDRVFHETEQEFMFADSTFFDVFSFRLLEGDPSTCLANPRNIVLTETYARKYFGDEDPIGKSLKIEQDTNLSVVTGVMEDIPVNSHFRPKMIGSLNTLGNSMGDNWVNHNYHTYVVLKEGTDPEEFEKRLHDMVIKYVGPVVVQFMGIDMEQFEAAGHSYGYRIQKLTDIHLHSDLQYEIQPGGNPLYVYIFLIAAILILVIAGINFMNLAIAQSSGRAREVGLRKVVGSGRPQIMAQFLTESVILSLMALVVAIVLVYLMLPRYNNLIQLQLEFDVFSRTWIIPVLLFFAILIGLAAGSYPAFVLASFRPVAALSPERKIISGRGGLRKLLIVMQFTVTIIILVCTVVVFRQLHFMQDKETGFTKENVLLVHRSDVLRQDIDPFKEELTQHSNILAVANATSVPSGQFSENAHWLEGWDRSEIFTLSSTYVSYNFDKALGLELVEGRFFDREISTDSSAVVINQSTVRALGLKDPLSTRFYEPGGGDGEDRFMPVIGVVRDFHFESMHKEIGPMAIHFMRGNYEGVMTIRLGQGDQAETLRFIEERWKEFDNEYPFEYSWMDERFNTLFAAERKTGVLLAVFAILSIFVTCLGLLGLISFTTSQRTREIGIRKIMGASVEVVIGLFSRETIRLLGIAALLSIPAYFGVRTWLQRFAYHIDLHVWIYFLLLGLVTLLVLVLALLTVSYHSYRAATANPAESVRTE